MTNKVIAVDGTAGSGKSSICSAVCKKKSWIYINTGALYRAVAYLLTLNKNTEISNTEIEQAISDFEKNYIWDESTQYLFYKGQNITAHLNSQSVGNMASSIAKLPLVRKNLLPIQKNLIKKYKDKIVLVDGRDIATVIAPDAKVKIFMTASIKERAKRRLLQLGQKIDLNHLEQEIKDRDVQDSTRKIAPLTKVKEAIELDTGSMDFEDCVDTLIKIIEQNI